MFDKLPLKLIAYGFASLRATLISLLLVSYLSSISLDGVTGLSSIRTVLLSISREVFVFHFWSVLGCVAQLDNGNIWADSSMIQAVLR